ncbi:hypothetical protein NECAME_06892 [Necator americanus]|uniref:Uncharacterized protein n=1 Tax=Necator americanus TaxID=51031 RepID=W2TQJ7_NECAM|nr:hypothetical protein NECAME_06892 [Necator americanus]ETN84330.1 hypothetical protein NECAME_06892 [Necator americanus]
MNSTDQLAGNFNLTWLQELEVTTEIAPANVAESWNWVVALIIILFFVFCSGFWILVRILFVKYCKRPKSQQNAEEDSKETTEGC